MKRILFTTMFIFVVSIFISCGKNNASSKVKKENLLKAEKRDENDVGSPIVKFDKESYNFGTVEQGDVIETSFVVTNVGKSDLMILDAKSTCGCTIPTWPKEPIAPGKSAEIKVKFNTAGKSNKQTKTVTLSTNTDKGSESVELTGMVKPKKQNKV